MRFLHSAFILFFVALVFAGEDKNDLYAGTVEAACNIFLGDPSDQSLPTLNELGNQTGWYKPTDIGSKTQNSSYTIPAQHLNQFVQTIIVKNFHCQQQYQMSFKEYQELMNCGYEKFVYRLFQQQLSDEAILKLWEKYKAKRWWNTFSEKGYYEKIIHERLHQRNVKREQQEQVKKKSERTQSAQSITPQNYDFEISNFETLAPGQKIIWQEREQALEKTKQQNFKPFSQQHFINDQVRGYLKAHDINAQEFEQLHGTIFQHHLQEEINSQLQHTAQLHDKFSSSNNLLNQTTLFSHAAVAANKAEIFPIVFDTHHLNCELLKICDIMSQEVWRLAGVMTETFVKEAMHTCNPVEIVKDLWSLTQLCWQHRMNMQHQHLLKRYSEQEIEQEELEEELRAQQLQKLANDPEHLRHITELRCQQFADIMHTVGQHSLDWYAHRSANQKSEDVLKGTAVVAANVLAPDIVFERLGIALCFAGNNLKRAKQFVTLCEDEYIIANALEEITTSIKAKEFIAEEKLLLHQAEKNIAIGSKAIRPFKVILEEIKALGGVIPFHKKEFLEEAKLSLAAYSKTFNQKIDLKLIQKYHRKTLPRNGSLVQSNLDINHIINFECKFQESKELGGYALGITGGHAPGSCQAIADAGLVKIIKKEVLPSGAIDYHLTNILTGKPIVKTEFPPGWSHEKIIQACWNAFENPSKIIPSENNTIFETVVGAISQDLELSLTIKKKIPKKSDKNLPTHNIVTAIPKRKK